MLRVGRVAILSMLVLLASAGFAVADNVQNDVVAGTNDTIPAGGSTTVQYNLHGPKGSGDGQAGCNASDGSSATVTINAPAGVTASPGSLVFTDCSSSQGVAFSSNTPGAYDITVSVSDAGPGSYNTNSAKFTLTVTAASDTTPPTLILPGDISVHATSSSGAVVEYQVSATDDQDPNPTVACEPPSGSTFALGATTVTCTAADASGNSATDTFTVTVTYDWSDFDVPSSGKKDSYKVGRTLPVRFQLDGDSAGITDATATLSYRLDGTSLKMDATSRAASTDGSLFRYDAEDDQYIFNWDTRGLAGGTYVLCIDLGDGTTNEHTVVLR